MSEHYFRLRAAQALVDALQRVDDEDAFTGLLQRLSSPSRPTVVSFLNQHALNLAWEDRAFDKALLASDLLLRDGIGIAALLRLQGRRSGKNLNGTDLIPRIVSAYAGRRVAVVGTAQPWLDQAVARLRALGAKVVYQIDGFQPPERSLAKIVAARPALVLLGMGMPRQELFAQRLKQALSGPVLIVNGGAILDFLAARFPRAPAWMRRCGLEWTYRLLREPRRLWHRYVAGGPRFIARACQLAMFNEDADTMRAAWEGAAAQALANGHHPAIEALLQRLDGRQGETAAPQVVHFLAVRAGDGASTVASGYAQACARLQGGRVLLLHDEAAGHRDSAAPWPALISGSPQPGLTVAAIGKADSAAAADPAQGTAVRGWLDADTWSALRSRFDRIVIDARVAGRLVAPHADGVVVVARAGDTPAAATARLLQRLGQVNATVLGVVLNRQQSHLPRVLHERL